MKIAVIVGTTRKGRITPKLAKWVAKRANEREGVEVELLDLIDYDMPFLNDEPWDPNRVLTEGTKEWLKALERSDGYIFVTAEYNHTIPPVLTNAIDFSNGEMVRKPAAIVSHGSVGGARANEHLRLLLNSMVATVTLPHSVTFFGKVVDGVDDDGNLQPGFEQNDKKLSALLDDLVWYTGALKAAKD